MSYKMEYERWLSKPLEDPDLAPELRAIADSDHEIRERFAIDLAFGTAGLRGVIGAGTNRMNIYTVRKATQGLAAYLSKAGEGQSVAISYDSRIKSDLFARSAAEVLAAGGIHVYLYPQLMPVPALSFAVRRLGASAGIMVTASHNPAKYNGYKVYGPDGCQMTTESADAVLAEINAIDLFDGVKVMPFDKALAEKKIEFISDQVAEEYYKNVMAQSVRPGLCAKAGLKLCYTPLNGAGNLPVRRVLAEIGVSDVTVVPEQEHPDGNFPTCPYPNPEIRAALEKGLLLMSEIGADLLLATDPDADRVGIAVREGSDYRLLSGNEVGVLLLDYICAARLEKGTMPQRPLMVKSIVTTCLADQVAESYGVEAINVLTGFKYIGEQILHLEEKGEEKRFIFGFEESYGYLSGTYVRDKDAVVASMLICEMAAYYKSIGSGILEALDRIYKKFGRWLHKVDSFEFEGLAGMSKMKELMSSLRANTPGQIGGETVVTVADYQSCTITQTATGKAAPTGLPTADVLVYTLASGESVIVRPSGTEPKIKVYYSTKGVDLHQAEQKYSVLAAGVNKLLNF